MLVLDLETTGLPDGSPYQRYYPYYDTEHYNSARVVQLSYAIYNNTGELMKLEDFTIKPDDFLIKNGHIHGISQEQAMATGIEFEKVVPLLQIAIENTDIIIGHNIQFDIQILASELHRRHFYKLASTLIKKKRYCTMLEGKKHFSLKKQPKLCELYKLCFSEESQNNHNAKYDVLNTAKCFFYLGTKYIS